MKKLGKLEINSERILKNEELISLRGGTTCVKCYEYKGGPLLGPTYSVCPPDVEYAMDICTYFYPATTYPEWVCDQNCY